MPTPKVQRRESVVRAVAEFEKLGRESFLDKYRYGHAKEYYLRHEGNLYDSKAILGVAHGYENDGGPLNGTDFSGGEIQVRQKLSALGFEVEIIPVASLDPLVLVENEVMADPKFAGWKDVTGERYHFPNQYRARIRTGRQFVYYRGSRRAGGKKASPEYFGVGKIGEVWVDPDTAAAAARNRKWFCAIEDYEPFLNPAPAKHGGKYYETIPKNMWSVGVRELDRSAFNAICRAAGLPSSAVEPIAPRWPDATAPETPVEVSGESLLIPRNPVEPSEQTGIGGGSNRRSKYAKAVGDLAEAAVNKYLQATLSPKERASIVWVARRGETPGWDIEFERDGEKICVEVKGTTGGRFPSFELTANEWGAAIERKGNYWISLVVLVGSKKPRIEFIKNLHQLHSQGRLLAEAAAWQISAVKIS
jgi:hypothetical protein